MEQKWHSLCAAFPDMPHEEDFSFRAHTTVGVGGCAPLALYPRGAAELAALLRYVSELCFRERLQPARVGCGV